jgi:D-alanyl-D-alanine endopeptidase (penicillin-binding protein 7)
VNSRLYKKFLTFLIGGFLLFLVFSNVSAVEILTENNFQIKLGQEIIKKGYTVGAFNDRIKLSLTPGIIASSTTVELLDLSNELFATSSDIEMISPVYQFEFKNKQAYNHRRPFYIQFDYGEIDNRYKELFFFDKNLNKWRPLPTKDYPAEHFVRSLIHLPYARIAVFAHPGTLTLGQTSWYSYKKGNFAASPDFPLGSRLRVKSLSSGKFVDVTVNDFGPDRKAHPDRVVDLEKTAFQAIAPLGAGVIKVAVEPLYIAPENGKVLGISEQRKTTSAVNNPVVKSGDNNDDINLKVKAAIALNENTGEVIWEKNADLSLPLASLTKLVFAKVFMDTKPDFDRTVVYLTQDEKYNQSFVDDGGAIAKLKVVNGEEMTVRDLLYSALVGSANNAVESLVRASGLERGEFIRRMNKYVQEVGAESTYFVEPSGLSPKNVSSVNDYALITQAVLKNGNIKKISTTGVYEFYTTNTKKYHRLVNTNKLITGNKYNITGSKTGYLVEAGYCLMSRVSEGGKNIIVVTFGAINRSTSFHETEKLIKYSLKNI